MQPFSDYEIAQRFIEQRQNKKTQFRTAVFILITAMFVALVGGPAGVCAIPIAVFAGVAAISLRIQLYYSAPENAPSVDEINQEITWLFGDDWHEATSTQIHAFAQERIRKRRVRKWWFLGHLLLFIPINGAIVIASLQGIAHPLTQATSVFSFLLLLAPFLWLIALILDFQSTFPSKQRLENQETHFGKTLQFELEHLQPEKAKEKLKRGKYYQVGDDGELEEVETDAEERLMDEKPKREMGNQ